MTDSKESAESQRWKTQFLQLLCSAQSGKDEIALAFSLKYDHRPKKIFKFRKVDQYSLDNLSNDTVWLARPSTLNDPYECLNFADFRMVPHPDFVDNRGILSKEFIFQVNEDFKKAAALTGNYSEALIDTLFSEYLDKPEYSNDIEQLKMFAKSKLSQISDAQADNFRDFFCLCAFSENLESMLMWSHYADMHRGFCIEYCLNQIEAQHPLMIGLNPVVYSDKRFDSTEHFANTANKIPSNGLAVFGAGLVKSTDWEYEREWRLLKLEKSPGSGQLFNVPKPSAVYLGSHISTANEAELMEICGSRGIPIKRMVHSREKFEMRAR